MDEILAQLLADLRAAASLDPREVALRDGRVGSVVGLTFGRARVMVARRRGGPAYDDGW